MHYDISVHVSYKQCPLVLEKLYEFLIIPPIVDDNVGRYNIIYVIYNLVGKINNFILRT